MRTSTRFLAGAALALAVIAGTAACSSSGSSDSDSASTNTATTSSLSGSITVFAAASLKGTFTDLAASFEKANPDVKVALSFAGSSDLVTQITEGAPADVFASADTKNMAKLTDASLTASDPVNFATNTLEIAVPTGNPASVTSFTDLAKSTTKTVVCAPEVPCGAAAATIEKATGVTIKPVSEESSVTDVLGKVSSGEADAGLVYVTDIKAAGDTVEGVTFPESSDAVNTYPIATLKDSQQAKIADAFVAYVTGTVGQGVLADAGFAKP